ncbi:antitoxin Xre/MbcA/ParS toxin-binding domain-containing protein [Solimonas sp. SE-A11]|uniref:antitoxin Xre/MbcA/ParS toxin-binding domain-containing protein n=1 Tax=Solimonas sp. SE-A11 TaxID=3054954 RepID=UPI0034606B84
MNNSSHWQIGLAEAERVFEDELYARSWLETPNAALGELTPRSLLDSAAGLTQVLRVLASIEHGLPL